jgi:hypothetical protein
MLHLFNVNLRQPEYSLTILRAWSDKSLPARGTDKNSCDKRNFAFPQAEGCFRNTENENLQDFKFPDPTGGSSKSWFNPDLDYMQGNWDLGVVSWGPANSKEREPVFDLRRSKVTTPYQRGHFIPLSLMVSEKTRITNSIGLSTRLTPSNASYRNREIGWTPKQKQHENTGMYMRTRFVFCSVLAQV